MCSLYLSESVHLHACGFPAASSVYEFWCLSVCVSWVSVFALCGFVSVFWMWVCLWPYVFVDSVYLHLWGLFSVFVCVCLCMCLYFFVCVCVCVCLSE